MAGVARSRGPFPTDSNTPAHTYGGGAGRGSAGSSGSGQGKDVFRQVKLAALVKGRWDCSRDVVRAVLPGGAALFDAHSGRAWVLVDDGSVRALGPALAWSRKYGAAQVDLLVEGYVGAAVLARRASAFGQPPGVWLIRGRDLEPARAASLEPDLSVPPDSEAFAQVLRDHGVEPVVQHGVLSGEVLGLEVARVVPVDGGYRIAVGVGRHDREARLELDRARWGGALTDVGAALDEAVLIVRSWRTAEAASHPANRIARERWLRSVVAAHPQLAGAVAVSPLPTPMPRQSLVEASPAPALALGEDGHRFVVVCSLGVDLDLVPTASDCALVASLTVRGTPGWDPQLTLVVPEGDDHPVTRALAAALRRPAQLIAVPSTWKSLPA
jgi:hypothetical protein